ncbi:hypothetical protein M2138_001641 [Dysgonomonadaceae bacterium PH5-43]|nr:hypothetical protein [Dysgonomonadaceae bacterium PH5-43]
MVKIYSFHNKVDYIRCQNKLFKKFITEEYQFFAVNTAESYEDKKLIKEECDREEVSCIELPFLNTHSTPSARNSIPLQWVWDNYIVNDESTTVIMDSDMFLLTPFNFTDFLGDNDIAGVINKRAHIWYPWNGLSIFSGNLPDKNTMNFREGLIDGVYVDVSGNLYHYIQKHSKLKVKNIYDGGFICSKNKNRHLLPDVLKERYEDVFLSQIFGQAFFHIRGGSNWNNSIAFDKKVKFTSFMVEEAMNDKIKFPSTNNYRFIDTDDIKTLEAPIHWTEYTRYVNGKWINATPKRSLIRFVKKLLA